MLSFVLIQLRMKFMLMLNFLSQRYQEAEEAFQNVLTLDMECLDAQFELEKVRVRILTVCL